jgi:hypothetical protein
MTRLIYLADLRMARLRYLADVPITRQRYIAKVPDGIIIGQVEIPVQLTKDQARKHADLSMGGTEGTGYLSNLIPMAKLRYLVHLPIAM